MLEGSIAKIFMPFIIWKSFTQFYGSTSLDSSLLLMEQYGFIDSKDPRYIKTVRAIEKNLCYNGLLYRYKNEDDFGLPSSSYSTRCEPVCPHQSLAFVSLALG